MNVKEFKEMLTDFPDEANVVIGLKIKINNNEKNMGSDMLEVGIDSNKETVWIDMVETLHIDSVAHTSLKKV